MASSRVLVLGATGRTGQQVVLEAVRQGHQVTAFVRNPDGVQVRSAGLRVLAGQVTGDDPALALAMRDQDVVISALGRGKSFRSGGLIAHSVPCIVGAMERAGVRRLVFTSAFGVGETYRDVPLLPRLFIGTLLRDIYRDKALGEQTIRASALDWTLVYPTGLVDGPATGHYRVGPRLALRGFPTVTRADVAAFLVTQVADPTYVRMGVLVSAGDGSGQGASGPAG